MATKPADDEFTNTLEEATERGYLGKNTDPTPDEAYSVAGRIADMPTPETTRSTDDVVVVEKAPRTAKADKS